MKKKSAQTRARNAEAKLRTVKTRNRALEQALFAERQILHGVCMYHGEVDAVKGTNKIVVPMRFVPEQPDVRVQVEIESITCTIQHVVGTNKEEE